MDSKSDTSVAELVSPRSSDVGEEEKMNKLKIKFGKDESGRITHGKIISERNENEKNQYLPHESSMKSYQLPLNPDDAFHGFPDSSVPDWVSDDFTGVDLQSRFNIKPTLCVTIGSKNYQSRRKQQHHPVTSVAVPVSVKTSDPPGVDAPNLKREGHFEIPKLIVVVPSFSPLSRKRVCKWESSEQFEIEVELKEAPVKFSTRRKSRSEKVCLLSSNISSSNSHMPDSEADMVCTDPEIPPHFLAASVDDWVEDEISLPEENPPLSQTETIPPASSPAPSPPTSSVTDDNLFNLPAGGGTSFVSTFSTQQNVPVVSRQSSLVSLQVASDYSVSIKELNPSMETGSGEEVTCPRASVIVKNPSQTTDYQVFHDQPLDKLMINSSEIIDLTDDNDSSDIDREDKCDVKAERSSLQFVIHQRSEGMSSTMLGRRPSLGRSSISYPGVEIKLVIPANNNHNTELKIKLNQTQVEELKNCLKEA